MEVRLIDSQSHHHAGRVVGTVIKTISSNNRTTHSVLKHRDHPAPFQYLLLRALESSHHAGTTEQEDGNAGNQTVVRLHPIIPSDKMAPTFYFGCPALFLPSSGPHSIPENQNADGTARSHFLLSSRQVSPVQNGSARTLPHRPSAPNSSDQNAGRAEVSHCLSSVRNSEEPSPPGRKTKLATRSPCASRLLVPSTSMRVIGTGKSASPFRRFLSYTSGASRRFLNYLKDKSAFNDESKEMTNFGWRKKA
jgi:hypothetical protein